MDETNSRRSMRIKSIHEKQELLKIKKKYHIRGEEMLKIQKI